MPYPHRVGLQEPTEEIGEIDGILKIAPLHATDASIPGEDSLEDPNTIAVGVELDTSDHQNPVSQEDQHDECPKPSKHDAIF